VSEQRGNGDGRPEKRWGPLMRWPVSSRMSMRCWRRWQLGWKTADEARPRGSFWWRFRTLAVGSGRATAASDSIPTVALGQQWGGEPRTGRAREARGGFGPCPDRDARTAVGWRASDRTSVRGGFGPRPDRGGALMAWRARPQLGARWETPPDKWARHRPQSH
jgi:hypothetical protein